MSASCIIWLNTAGLSLGVLGAFGLAFLVKVLIRIEPDGHQVFGPPNGMTNEEWLRHNRRLRFKQKYGFPLSYGAIAVGFLCQIVALWLPSIAK